MHNNVTNMLTLTKQYRHIEGLFSPTVPQCKENISITVILADDFQILASERVLEEAVRVKKLTISLQ